MSRLKRENVTRCVSLLREYIDETALRGKQEIAILALNQLQRITAGVDTEPPPAGGDSAGDPPIGCHGRPTADAPQGGG